MPDFKEIAKSGWHPKGKDGKGESWRSDFKGVNQVAGWLGKGKDTGSSIPAEYHTSRPLSSLQDPASFGPPPKHIYTTQPNQATPDTTGFVAPSGKGELQQETATEGTKPRPPPVPFRIDTTGLSTSHLPPPPKRKGGGADAKTPLPQAPKPKPPVLPPRLSSRLGPSPVSSLPQKVFQEPDAHKGILNQDSLRRLGAAGVSVPTLGIGPPSADSLVQTQSAPTNNAAQLNELQSRFSRLSSNIPGPGIPEGTSLVHKQKALKPPPQYRKDLSSPLPSDPRSEQPAGLGKKKPPPPPVKKASLLSSASSIDTTPPPIPLSSKPNPQSVELDAQDLDLDLKSLWFAKSPPSFPPASINRLPGSRSFASSSGWTSSGVRKTHTFTGAIRHCNTLATTIIHLTWDSSNPGVTIKAQQRHIPPPRKLTREELDINRDEYSDEIASWSESKMGQQVGDGECWTLANEALKAIGTKASSMGREACMSSQSYVHGALIYSYIPATSPYPDPRGGIREASVARGDILQLLSAYFKSKDGRSEKWAGAPDHTAVVVGVKPNDVLSVVEQNIGGVKKVREGTYDMSELVKGEVRIFRAVGEGWVGKLEPKW